MIKFTSFIASLLLLNSLAIGDIKPIAIEKNPAIKKILEPEVVVAPESEPEEIIIEDSSGDEDVAPIVIVENEDSTLATLNINFKISKWDIPSRYDNQLLEFTEYLEEHPEYQIIVYGHTDNRGRVDDNLILSKKRAKSVLEALVANGIDKIRITAIGKGESQAIDTNMYKAGRANNRRIEVELIK